ncbi:MAG: M48 family metallopeptidase [Campylobacterota bacterium]|nr:M48 family metallopeptidase [Campylobacterota bacterium]
MYQIDAELFDGENSSSWSVKVYFYDDKRVEIIGKDFKYKSTFENLKFSSRLGNTTRVISLKNGSVLHSKDNDTIDNVLKNLLNHHSFVHKLESSTKHAVTSLVLLLAFILFFVTIGADMSAKAIASVTPQDIKTNLGDKTLEVLDEYYLKESFIDKNRQLEIQAIFKKIANGDKRYQLHFRRGMGINAFALPSGDIIMSDELVKLAASNDDMIFGILAHEKGHIELNHSIQIMVKSSIVGAIVGYFTGDFASVVGGMSASLVEANYSREYEREADRYAKMMMQKHNVNPKGIAEFFTQMNKKYGDHNGTLGFFASHPSSMDRAKFFEE